MSPIDATARSFAGGFYFGRCGSQWIPHVSPVPAAFAIQALSMWESGQAAARVI